MANFARCYFRIFTTSFVRDMGVTFRPVTLPFLSVPSTVVCRGRDLKCVPGFGPGRERGDLFTIVWRKMLTDEPFAPLHPQLLAGFPQLEDLVVRRRGQLGGSG